MLIRLSLILAILAGLAAGIVNFTVVKGKIDTLTNDRNDQRSQKEQAQRDLASTRKTLKETQDTLETTKTQLAASETKVHKLSDDLVAETAKADDLTTKLNKTSQDLDVARGDLQAYKNTGLTAPQVNDLNKELHQTQQALAVANQEKLVMTHTIGRLNNQVDELLGTGRPVVLPAGLKGEVMAVDPKWDFVVLNVGEDQGVLQNGELLVSRDGKLVAKVIVRSVQRDRCIANMVPGWKLGDVFEGDQVIPAHPAS
jgi:predicted RNase H-like nuclease (RuvC/YqgF family)